MGCRVFHEVLPPSPVPGRVPKSEPNNQEEPALTNQGDEQRWCLTIPNRMKHVGEANRSLAAYLDEQGVDPEMRSTAELALEEVVTNVIKYAYDNEDLHEISLTAHRGPAGLVLRVEDDGRAFNPLDVPPPDPEKPFEDREEGGLGIHLLRRFAEKLEYQRFDGRNILTVRMAEKPHPNTDRSASCL